MWGLEHFQSTIRTIAYAREWEPQIQATRLETADYLYIGFPL